MNSDKKTARLAGFLYLLVIIFGVFAELYVRAELIVPNNAVETLNNIRANKSLLRLGFISDLLMQTAFFLLPFPLYRLFKRVNKNQAMLMVLSVMVSVAIMCLNMLHQFAAILILERENSIAVFDAELIGELVFLFLDLQKHGYRIAQIFFGLWLFPLGYLSYKSGFIPKIIGVFLMVACFSFFVDFFLFFMLSDYNISVSALITLPTTIGEFAMCFWLLIKGVQRTD
jgi:hypothetical protein